MSADPDQDLRRRRSERRLSADLAAPDIQAGVLRGDWRIARIEWPYLFVIVAASERTTRAREVALRVDVTNYPEAPTATPWDLEGDCILPGDRRPSSGRATLTFRADWENGQALYLPVDRVALAGHPAWAHQHARDAWDPERGLIVLLTLVHTILNEVDDAPAVAAA